MDVGLGWLGVVIGLAGCIVTYGMASGAAAVGDDESRRRVRSVAGLTLLVALVFWAVAMQTRLPFSPGQRLGMGFLIGGIAGALAQMLAYRLAATGQDDQQRRLAMHSVAFFALFGASLTYSIFHNDPQTAVLGFAVGAVMSGILAYYSRDMESPAGVYAEAWSILSITIAVGIWLSVAHFNSIEQRNWWPLPILIASTILIASYIGTELSSFGRLQGRPGLSKMLPTVAVIVIILGLTAIYSARIVQDWALLTVVAVGMAIAGIATWLASKLNVAQDGAAGLDVASAVVLLTVAFAVAAFKLWSGLGIAVGLLAAWAIALFQFGTGEAAGMKSRTLRGVLALGLVILLFKVFVERYHSEIGSADLRIHYTFIGALLGAILPFTFVSTLARMRSSAESNTMLIAQVASIGLAAALSPLLLFMVWDIKVVLGFVFGLAAAIAFLLMVGLSKEDSLLSRESISLLAVGAQLSAIVFTAPLIEIELTRMVRISMLGAVVLVAAVWLVLTGIWSARRSR